MKGILTYDAYIADYGGTVADKRTFDRLAAKAAQIIHRATHGRLVGETPARECVKLCACELIEMLYAQESLGSIAQGREIASVANDGVSMSFATGDGGNAAQAAQARCMGIVRTWLEGETTADGVNLLYAGVDA